MPKDCCISRLTPTMVVFVWLGPKNMSLFLSSKLVQSDWFWSNYWINIYISSLKNTFFIVNKSCSNFLGGKKRHHIFWIKFCNFGRLTQSAGSVKILSLYSMCTTNMCTALRKTSCCGHVVVSLSSHVKPRLGLYLVAHFAVKKLIPRFVLFSLINKYNGI